MKRMYVQNGKVFDFDDLDVSYTAEAVFVEDGTKSGTVFDPKNNPFEKEKTEGILLKGAPFNIDVADTMKNSVGKIDKILYDDINHPKRYIKGGMECIDAIEAAVSNLPGKEGFLVGQIIKYIWRYREKDAVSSLEKAEWYLKRLIESVKANEA